MNLCDLIKLSNEVFAILGYDVDKYENHIHNNMSFIHQAEIQATLINDVISHINKELDKNHFSSYALMLILSFAKHNYGEKLQAEFWYLYSKCSLKINSAHNAINGAENALRQYRDQKQYDVITVFVTANIATASRNSGDFAHAIKYYLKAKEISGLIGYKALENWQVFRLGKMYINYLNQISRGVDYITQALDNFLEMGNHSSEMGAAACLDELGDVYRQKTIDISLAEDFYRKALKKNTKIGNLRGKVRNIAHLALVEELKSNIPRARELLERAVGILRQIDGEERGLGLRLGQLARICLKGGDALNAEKYLDEAVQLSKRYKDKIAIIKNEILKGTIQSTKKEYEQAIASYHKSIELSRSANNFDLQIDAYNELFNIYFYELEDYEKAKRMILHSMEVKKEAYRSIFESNPSIEDVENKDEIGSMYKSLYEKVLLDSQNEFESMIKYINQAYNLALEENKERSSNMIRLFQAGALMAQVSHDVHSLLNSIVSAVNNIMSSDKTLSSEALYELGRIKERSLRGCDALRASITQPIFSPRSREKGCKSLKSILPPIFSFIEDECIRNNIELNLPPGIPDYSIKCDAETLKVIVANVIQNSIDALVESKKKELSFDIKLSDSKKVDLIVADNGPGISSIDLKDVFQIGFSTKPNHFGIGLSTVKFLVESVGGNISIESDLGEGTAVVIEFNLCKEIDNGKGTSN